MKVGICFVRPELEKAAKKIVQNCDGLPLAIIIVGKHLSKSEKTLEYWTNVAEKQIPIFDSTDDLEVFDALTIRFYNFPFDILKLVRLRYVAFTYNGELPASISKLWGLQYLIVRQHLSIKYSGVGSYLPMEIWSMKELRHLQVMGSNLPNPCGGSLLNLLTLSDVSPHSCTEEVLKGTPNLKK
ncbi:hypothetical protein BUALT_Bualt11G0069600 [Buddleja alternifolia]|uniref:NB-ARC domain-containing protein n=1 Tax=Buddleja alternifolia TaxID=168488 RepID=A0AAV6X162_9LAMI|nr:hypothetical protein BUALT_Bualt11G0069600 [Buddleja alternifolia]